MTKAKMLGIKVGAFVSTDDIKNAHVSEAVTDFNNGALWCDVYSKDATLEAKGYEGITEIEVESAYNDSWLPITISITGKKPVALSYRNGKDGFKDYAASLFLGCRNSGKNGRTDYGAGYGNPNNVPYSLSRFKSLDSTSRWYDDAKVDNSFATRLSTLSSDIDATMQNGGWYSNFTHWHQYVSGGHIEWAEAYLNMLAAKNNNNEIAFCGFGEAVAYLVYRSIVTKAVMFAPVASPNTLKIQLETIDTFGIDTDLLQVPISIRFTTIGTPLAGKSIKSNCNLISEGNGSYVVEIPYSAYPSAIIEEDV